ncbi:MAG: phosphatase domain-containing protein [Candidatus Kariarchaeaceae archaeon]|jgi:protein-tyrosine phosphatase
MKPDNFSWIDNFVAGSSKPQIKEHIDYFLSQGITHMISLTTESPLVMHHVNTKLAHHHIPIFNIPDQHQITQFKHILQEVKAQSGKIVVHCQFGQERTGVFLALYLMEHAGMKADEAKKLVQKMRPGSLRTSITKEFLDNCN